MSKSSEIKTIYPLREKKRSNTRAVLISTCDKLISRDGYKNMTMQAVANEAGIHVQTLYKHFPTKFDLAATSSCETLRNRMKNRHSDTLNEWKSYVTEKASEITEYDKGALFLETIDITMGNEYSKQLTFAIANETIEILTENIAMDLSMDKSDDLLPKIIGNLLYTTSTHNTLSWHKSGGEKDLVKTTNDSLDEIFRLINVLKAEYKLK